MTLWLGCNQANLEVENIPEGCPSKLIISGSCLSLQDQKPRLEPPPPAQRLRHPAQLQAAWRCPSARFQGRGGILLPGLELQLRSWDSGRPDRGHQPAPHREGLALPSSGGNEADERPREGLIYVLLPIQASRKNKTCSYRETGFFPVMLLMLNCWTFTTKTIRCETN